MDDDFDARTDADPAAGLQIGSLDLFAIAAGAAVSLLASSSVEVGILVAGWSVMAVIIVRSDLQHLIIPDAAVVMIGGLGLSCSQVAGWDLWKAGVSLANGAGAFSVFWLIGSGYRWLTGRIGLGFGDVKLAAASAVWLTPGSMALAVEIAAISAAGCLLLRRSTREVNGRAAIPFGAFLAPSAWLVFIAEPLLSVLRDRFA